MSIDFPHPSTPPPFPSSSLSSSPPYLPPIDPDDFLDTSDDMSDYRSALGESLSSSSASLYWDALGDTSVDSSRNASLLNSPTASHRSSTLSLSLSQRPSDRRLQPLFDYWQRRCVEVETQRSLDLADMMDRLIVARLVATIMERVACRIEQQDEVERVVEGLRRQYRGTIASLEQQLCMQRALSAHSSPRGGGKMRSEHDATSLSSSNHHQPSQQQLQPAKRRGRPYGGARGAAAAAAASARWRPRRLAISPLWYCVHAAVWITVGAVGASLWRRSIKATA